MNEKVIVFYIVILLVIDFLLIYLFSNYLNLVNVNKKFEGKTIIEDFSVTILPNEFVAITGRSGTGKTTLLNLMGLLDVPDQGTIRILNYENPNLKTIRWLRRHHFGYIFQNYLLIERKTVRDNLLLSMRHRSRTDKTDMVKALEKVQLNDSYLEKKVYQLSGGEQQRLAIARIILKPCDIIFADEPTGNLDHENKLIIQLSQLTKSNKPLLDMGVASIIYTH